MALQDAFNRSAATNKTKLKRLAALDHSDLCTKVFEHNFGGSNNKTFNIEQLTLKQVENWHADIYVMSPPCQPHTRQHSNQDQDLEDPRSVSFLHICGLLHDMGQECLPKLLFLENVIGFETSRTFRRWQQVLDKRGYHVGHFHLNPPQVGLPNDRPRYFCVAVLNLSSASSSTSNVDLRRSLKSYLGPPSKSDAGTTTNSLNNLTESSSTPTTIWKAIPELNVHPEGDDSLTLPTMSSFLEHWTSSSSAASSSRDEMASLRIPQKLLTSNSAWCFDIVCPHHRRSACFTQSYGRFVRGTGSILYEHDDEAQTTLANLNLLDPQDREFCEDWSKGLDTSRLRYFSGTELTRLFGFSNEFVFPADVSMKQQWKLMGNSLNVGIASRVVELGIWLSSLPDREDYEPGDDVKRSKQRDN
jgi:tRNA (cytosine38-C5)-methyltransferase